MLDPQARALLELMAERGVPAVHTLSPVEARRAYRDRRGFTQPDATPVGSVESLSFAGPRGPVGVRLYRPPGASASLPGPALLYFHGGGWTIGDLDTHDVLCRQLCARAGIVVLSVDYALAPEQRFPAAADDAAAAWRWLQGAAPSLGVDRGRIAVGGDSAGATLSAGLALAVRDTGAADQALPAFQLLIYPAADMRHDAPSHRSNGQGYLLTADSLAYYRSHYLADLSQWTDWRASPLLAPDLSGLPPALVLTAGFDPLRDEGRQYADALSAAGNAVQYVCFERQIHGFITMGRVIDEAHTAVDLCAAVLRRTLAA
ncbi:MAG: alpha/beta hydrolase [Pseudomonadota bacterium]